jgi:hypothetical protein
MTRSKPDGGTEVSAGSGMKQIIPLFLNLAESIIHGKYIFKASIRRDGSSRFGKMNDLELFQPSQLVGLFQRKVLKRQ